MLFKQSHLRLVLISHLRLVLISCLRPVSHPLLLVPSLKPSFSSFVSSPSPSLSSPFSSTTRAMYHQVSHDPWNKLHDEMVLFHNHFRTTFNNIYKRCDSVTAEDRKSVV